MTATHPAPERAGRLDAEAVATAAITVAGRGQLVSATAVQRELGRGSMVTVAKHLKAWAGNAMPLLANKVTAPKWTARELEGMSLLRKVFREEAAAALAERRAAADEEVQTAKATAATATERAKQAEDRASGLETSIAALTEQLTAANRAGEERDAQIARLQATNAEQSRQYDKTVDELRQQAADAVVRYDGMEKHMLRQIDHSRTEHAAAMKRMDEDLTLTNARFQRVNTDLDRVRGERDRLEARAAKAEAELAEAVVGRASAERRLSVAEGQIATLIERTDRLATAQGSLAEQLVAAQRAVAEATSAHLQLVRASSTLVDATPETCVELSEAMLTHLAKAAATVRALLPTS